MAFRKAIMRSPKSAVASPVVPILSTVRSIASKTITPPPIAAKTIAAKTIAAKTIAARSVAAKLIAVRLIPSRAIAALLIFLGVGCGKQTETVLTLDDLVAFPSSVEWSTSESETIVGGTGRGYLATANEYDDCNVSLEYRFLDTTNGVPTKDANTGLLLLIGAEDKVWPVCIEAQGKWSEMGAIKSNGGLAAVESTLRTSQRDAARRPPGEWNLLDAAIQNGTIRVRLNGVPVATSDTAGLARGRIGFQAEGHPIEVRRFRVRTDESGSSTLD